jgi:UDP-N-acetylmuramoyl-tripeptide--D-alanyl-D-alanine ligase
MHFTLGEIASATGGALSDGAAAALTISGCRTDSREVQHGDLFVPVVAQRDGHDFVDQAIAGGATAWLTSRPDSRRGAVLVSDTEDALKRLGGAARARLAAAHAPVIGVTGSSGKTSTKDLIRAILRSRGPAGASEKSFNNELGVPLTLLNAPDDAQSAVIEMGARGIGHIALLCSIAKPTVGVVTNVGTAHLEMYDSPDGLVQAKGEIVEALPETGSAVLCFDDASMPNHRSRTKATVFTFSAHSIGADMWAEAVTLDAELRAHFTLHSPWGSAPIRLEARGEHQVLNALAAAGACLSSGFSMDHVVAGLVTSDLSPWRMELGRTPSGIRIINDAYNANDQSMTAALKSLASLPARCRVAVIGTMAELGDHSATAHATIASLCATLGLDHIVAVNEPRYGDAAQHVSDRVAAVEALRSLQLTNQDAVLIKASRSVGLEQLATDLLGGALETRA